MAFSSDPQETLNEFVKLIIDCLTEIGSPQSLSPGFIGIKWDDDFDAFSSKMYKLGFCGGDIVDHFVLHGEYAGRPYYKYYKFFTGMNNFIQVFIGSRNADISDITLVLMKNANINVKVYDETCHQLIYHIRQKILDTFGQQGVFGHDFDIKWNLTNVNIMTSDWPMQRKGKTKCIIRIINKRANQHHISEIQQISDNYDFDDFDNDDDGDGDVDDNDSLTTFHGPKHILPPPPILLTDDSETSIDMTKGNAFRDTVDPQLRLKTSEPTDSGESASLRHEVSELRELILALTSDLHLLRKTCEPADSGECASLQHEVSELRELILAQTAKIGSAEDNIASLMRSMFEGLKKEERIQRYSAPHDEGDPFL